MPGQSLQDFAPSQIPDSVVEVEVSAQVTKRSKNTSNLLHSAIVTARNDLGPIRGDSDRVDIATVSRQSTQDLAPGEIPHPVVEVKVSAQVPK